MLVYLLLLESEKVIGKIDAEIVKMQEDPQKITENTTLERKEPKHSKFKENLSQKQSMKSGTVVKSTTYGN